MAALPPKTISDLQRGAGPKATDGKIIRMTIFDYETPLGGCTEDINDCEVFRAAFTLKNVDQANEPAQELRKNLATVACGDCTRIYLNDVYDPAEIKPPGHDGQISVFASEIIWVDTVES